MRAGGAKQIVRHLRASNRGLRPPNSAVRAQVEAVPVTPLHFGPGALVSAVANRSVSFLAFCAANVLIDFESLRNMLTDQPRIHTFFHTYVGATLAALMVVVLFLSARWLATRLPEWRVLSWRHLPVAAVALGAIIGAWSHVLLDSVMHADITPFAPFSDANGLYRVISISALHIACVVSGVLGAFWWLLRSNSSLERAREP